MAKGFLQVKQTFGPGQLNAPKARRRVALERVGLLDRGETEERTRQWYKGHS